MVTKVIIWSSFTLTLPSGSASCKALSSLLTSGIISALQKVSSKALRLHALTEGLVRWVSIDTWISGRFGGFLGLGTASRYWGWTGNPGGELGLGVGEGAAACGGGERRGVLLGLDFGVEVDESELRSLAPRHGALLDEEQFKSVF